MSNGDILAAIERITARETLDGVGKQLIIEIANLGMTAAASGMVTGAHAKGPTPFHFAIWPPDWLARYQLENFVAIDPVPRWAIVSGEPTSWTNAISRLSSKDPGRKVYEAAKAHGFYQGYVTPVRTKNGDLGVVSIGGGERGQFLDIERLFIESVSGAALRRADEISNGTSVTLLPFTAREQECVALLKRGYSDYEIGKALNISPATARFHIDNARRKAGAKNRIDLASGSNRVD